MRAMKNYLRAVGRHTVANAKNTLITKGIKGSQLEESISYRLKVDKNNWTIQFSMSDYGKFMNDGVKGTDNEPKYFENEEGKRVLSEHSYSAEMPPVKVFEAWIKRKGIQGRNKKTGRFIKRKSLAFAMAKNRQLRGYNGLSFFTKPLSIALKKFPKDLLKSIEKDFYTSIKELERINKTIL